MTWWRRGAKVSVFLILNIQFSENPTPKKSRSRHRKETFIFDTYRKHTLVEMQEITWFASLKWMIPRVKVIHLFSKIHTNSANAG